MWAGGGVIDVLPVQGAGAGGGLAVGERHHVRAGVLRPGDLLAKDPRHRHQHRRDTRRHAHTH